MKNDIPRGSGHCLGVAGSPYPATGVTRFNYSCCEYKSILETELHLQQELEESRDGLLRVHEANGFCIAISARGEKAFPTKLESQLCDLIGKKTEVLRGDSKSFVCDTGSEASSAESIQEIAASQLHVSRCCYNNVLSQSRTSFYFTLAASGLVLLFFMAAVSFLLVFNSTSSALITTLGGTLCAFFSRVSFDIYKKSSSQLADFHQRLDMTQRFLLSDSLCNSIRDPAKQDSTRANLIMNILGKDSKR